MMRKTITKLFWAWNYDKEEKWLNEMAAKGLALIAVGYCRYTFEECRPGEYNVRLELLENVPTALESTQYIRFIEESGAEYLGSVMRWVYFRRKTDDREFHLYSDYTSRIKHLNRLLALIGVVCVINILIGLSNSFIFLVRNNKPNLLLGIISLSLGLFLALGYVRVFKKKRTLKKLQNLYE